MATITYEQEVNIGMQGEQIIKFEVEFYSCPDTGDTIVEDFYAEAVTYDANGWQFKEKVPAWFYEHLRHQVEDFKGQLLHLAAEDAEY
tara:strand:- start:1171 stop:1434 length:264 start_codon:yes stop_codon:yes gene_type:complete